MQNYKIITADSADNLEKIINSYLDAGYTLVGGFQITRIDTTFLPVGSTRYQFFQAVVKP